jgi:uncharacterized protein (DUF1501 family)
MQRRNFIKTAALTSLALPLHINGFGMMAHGEGSPLMQQLEGLSAAVEDRVLVIINLVGGNDGFNMVIPTSQYSSYYNLRSNIAIPVANILPLDGTSDVGLHPSLGGLQNLYNQGMVSIVHSAGYPSPSQSHARSSDIWMTGVSSNQYSNTGWAGRFLQQKFVGFPNGYPNPTMEDPLALQIGYTSTPTLQGDTQSTAVTISNAEAFYQLIGQSSNVAGADLPCCDAGDLVTYIRNQQVQAVGYSVEIKNAADAGTNLATYPTANKLADQLKIVARLIHGGLKSKIYFVSLDGFDTHSTQIDGSDPLVGNHATLMKKLGDSIAAFYQDLKLQGTEDRVLSMTFSEFGRRANSNASKGTDHGYASPLFVIGKAITKQQIGTAPNLVTDLLPLNPQPWETQRDINMQIDFRRIYADVLTDWLGNSVAGTQDVLFQSFNTTSLLKATIETAKTGLWTDRSTWSAGRPPLPTETVIVNPGHTLNVTQNATIHKLIVKGDLQVKAGVLLNITGKV